ncbi:hypothetical protein Ntsu_48410 [Nocardia sp. IFM 10818]
MWNEVKNFFDPDLMGRLPDVLVEGTSVSQPFSQRNVFGKRALEMAVGGVSASCEQIETFSSVVAQHSATTHAMTVRPIRTFTFD